MGGWEENKLDPKVQVKNRWCFSQAFEQRQSSFRTSVPALEHVSVSFVKLIQSSLAWVTLSVGASLYVELAAVNCSVHAGVWRNDAVFFVEFVCACAEDAMCMIPKVFFERFLLNFFE